MTTENRGNEGSESLTNPPGSGIRPDAPDMPDSRVVIDPVALQQGHEPDTVDLRGVLYVPAALVVTFVIAYTVVTLVINSTKRDWTPPGPNEDRDRRAQAPLNERLSRIEKERLEGLQEFKGDPSVRPGDPAYLRSRVPAEEGNSPQYHPEELRPNSEHGKKLGLQDYGPVREEWRKQLNLPATATRIPVEEAIKIVGGNSAGKKDQPYLAAQMKDGKPVELADLLGAGPKPSNPQWDGPAKAKKDKKDPHAGHGHGPEKKPGGHD